MKASVAFIFFMLFLAGVAFVNLRGMQDQSTSEVVTAETLSASAWLPERLGEMTLAEGTGMWIRFGTDGNISGHGGCNGFFGSYELTVEGLKIGPLGATRRACPEPAMSFEMSYLEALQSVASAAASGSRLTLRNAQGDTLIRFVATEVTSNQ